MIYTYKYQICKYCSLSCPSSSSSMLIVEQEAIVIATNFRAQFLLQHGVSAGNLPFPIPGRSIVSMARRTYAMHDVL